MSQAQSSNQNVVVANAMYHVKLGTVLMARQLSMMRDKRRTVRKFCGKLSGRKQEEISEKRTR
jgi:hypothetical protein